MSTNLNKFYLLFKHKSQFCSIFGNTRSGLIIFVPACKNPVIQVPCVVLKYFCTGERFLRTAFIFTAWKYENNYFRWLYFWTDGFWLFFSTCAYPAAFQCKVPCIKVATAREEFLRDQQHLGSSSASRIRCQNEIRTGLIDLGRKMSHMHCTVR